MEGPVLRAYATKINFGSSPKLIKIFEEWRDSNFAFTLPFLGFFYINYINKNNDRTFLVLEKVQEQECHIGIMILLLIVVVMHVANVVWIRLSPNLPEPLPATIDVLLI